MRIGVISDTHIPVQAAALPAAVRDHFQGVEHILHAGDCVGSEVLDTLTAIAPVTAVAGNMDRWPLALPVKREMEFAGRRIGIIHGSGLPRANLHARLRECFDHPDVIVYGHTHQPFWGLEQGVYYMNPGSPTDTRFAPFCSVGLLTLTAKGILGEIVRIG